MAEYLVFLNASAQAIRAEDAGFDLEGGGFNAVVALQGPWEGRAQLLSVNEVAMIAAAIDGEGRWVGGPFAALADLVEVCGKFLRRKLGFAELRRAYLAAHLNFVE